MAITFVSVSALNVDAGSGTVTGILPTGWAQNDLLVKVIVSPGNRTVTLDGNYTEVANVLNSTDTIRLVVGYRVASSSESNPNSSYSAPGSGASAAMIALRGIDTGTPMDATRVTDTSTAATTWEPSGITTVNDDAWVLSIVCTKDDNDLGLDVGNEQGFTARMSGNAYDTTTLTDHSMGLASKEITSNGAVTNPTWEQTVNGADVWCAITMAIRPAGKTVTSAPVEVAVSTIKPLFGLFTTASVAAVNVALTVFDGDTALDVQVIEDVLTATVELPVASVVTGLFPILLAGVAVGVTIPARYLTPSVLVSPVRVTVNPSTSREFLDVQTITAREVGYFARDTAEPILVLVYGLDRSLPRGWSSGEGWQIVSQRFVFNDSPEGKTVLDQAVEGAWAADKLSSQSVLTGAIDQALQNAGFRRPDGGDIVSSVVVEL